MQHNVSNNVATVETTTTLDTLEVIPGLFAFKLTTSARRLSQHGSMKTPPVATKPRTVQGFVDQETLNKITSGHSWKPDETYLVLPPAAREFLRTNNPNIDTPERKEFRANMHKDVYDAFSDGRVVPGDIVRFDPKRGAIFTLDDKILPHAIFFDYMSNGRISNKTYDLDKLIAHLLPRDDIRFFPKTRRREDPDYSATASTAEEALLEIPYYNRDSGRENTVAFRWAPSQEAYQAIWDALPNKNKDYPLGDLYSVLFETDALGLRACGAALCDSYWKDAETQDEDEDLSL